MTTSKSPNWSKTTIHNLTATEILVPLGQIVVRDEEYSHRDPVEGTRPNLETLINSIGAEGLREPLECFKDGDKTGFVLISGHRRLAAMKVLAEEGHPNFTLETPVKVRVYQQATHEDLLVQSVSGNINRQPFSARERLQIVAKFQEKGVLAEQAAASLKREISIIS